MALSLVWVYFFGGNLVRKTDGSGILEEFRINSKAIWFLPYLGEFPSCCPVYDCPEDAEIVYKNKKGAKSSKSPRTLEGEE